MTSEELSELIERARVTLVRETSFEINGRLHATIELKDVVINGLYKDYQDYDELTLRVGDKRVLLRYVQTTSRAIEIVWSNVQLARHALQVLREHMVLDDIASIG